jgi:hypothetical protein
MTEFVRLFGKPDRPAVALIPCAVAVSLAEPAARTFPVVLE